MKYQSHISLFSLQVRVLPPILRRGGGNRYTPVYSGRKVLSKLRLLLQVLVYFCVSIMFRKHPLALDASSNLALPASFYG